MSFVQLIEITTTNPHEVEAVTDEWVTSTRGRRKAWRATLAADRDMLRTYVQIVEFDSYEEAMENSALAETSIFAERLGKLCETPPMFRNLDVQRAYDLG